MFSKMPIVGSGGTTDKNSFLNTNNSTSVANAFYGPNVVNIGSVTTSKCDFAISFNYYNNQSGGDFICKLYANDTIVIESEEIHLNSKNDRGTFVGIAKDIPSGTQMKLQLVCRNSDNDDNLYANYVYGFKYE